MFPAPLGCWDRNNVRHKIVEFFFKNIWSYASLRDCRIITIIITKLRSNVLRYCCYCSVAQACPNPCDPMDCSMPDLPVQNQLPEFTQTKVLESATPSNHLILCCPLLLLPSIFPSLSLGLEWKLTVSSFWDLIVCQLPCKMFYKHHFIYSSQLCEVGIIITFCRQTMFRGIK